MKWYVADFEATQDPKESHVWLWMLMDEYGNESHGYNIDTFINTLLQMEPSKIYFHNLQFDGEYILIWLLEHGFRYSENHEKGTFDSLVSAGNEWYSIYIFFHSTTIIIKDSMKLITKSVENIGKEFDVGLVKGKIDYLKRRDENYFASIEEIEYIKKDCKIIVEALRAIKKIGVNKDTKSSSALSDYKKIVGDKLFKYWFPELEYDSDIRRSYKGGFVYLNPKYKGLILPNVISMDVNSMYAWVLKTQYLPYGPGIRFEGKPISDGTLFIVNISVCLDLKPGKLPSVICRSDYFHGTNQYITSTEGDIVTLSLTSVDYYLMLENYYIAEITYYGGWYYRKSNLMFSAYIDKWYNYKWEAKRDGNKWLEFVAKNMLTNLYGKFGTRPLVTNKEPMLIGRTLHFKPYQERKRKPVYLPVASFVSSYARERIIRTGQLFGDDYIYSDTDSIKVFNLDYNWNAYNIEIDPYKLGAYKIDGIYANAKFLKQKCYMYQEEFDFKVVCSGLPEDSKQRISFYNFDFGSTFQGPKRPKHVPGGIYLQESKFTILE